MDKALFKKTIQEIEEYKKFNTDSQKPHKWYIITDDGVRYNHIPPLAQIKLDEANNCLNCIHLETGNSPSPSISWDRVTLDKIISVGSMYTDKKECDEMLKGFGVTVDKDREAILDAVFNPPRY